MCARVNAHLNDHVAHVRTHARTHCSSLPLLMYVCASARPQLTAAMRNTSAVLTELREVVLCVPLEEEVRGREIVKRDTRYESRQSSGFFGAAARMRVVMCANHILLVSS